MLSGLLSWGRGKDRILHVNSIFPKGGMHPLGGRGCHNRYSRDIKAPPGVNSTGRSQCSEKKCIKLPRGVPVQIQKCLRSVWLFISARA